MLKVNYNNGVKIDTAPTRGLSVSILMDGKYVGGTQHITALRATISPGIQMMPFHSHQESDEISYVVRGNGRFWIDGNIIDAETGDLVLQPIQSKHTVKNIGKEPLVLLCFHTSPDIRKAGRYKTYPEIQLTL